MQTPFRLLSVCLLLSVWLAVPARAQTTTTTAAPPPTTLPPTTTTSSPPPPTTTTATTTTVTTTTAITTTTTIPITVGVCKTAEHIQPGGYFMEGTARGALSYTTGGMPFAVPATMKAAANCICHSPYRKIQFLLFGSMGGMTFSWDPVALTILGYTASATQVTSTTDLHTLDIPFVAVCQ